MLHETVFERKLECNTGMLYLCIFICFYMYLHTGVNSIKVYVEIPESSVNYLFDGASLQQINKNLNWKAEANKRIEQIRKAPLNIR